MSDNLQPQIPGQEQPKSGDFTLSKHQETRISLLARASDNNKLKMSYMAKKILWFTRKERLAATKSKITTPKDVHSIGRPVYKKPRFADYMAAEDAGMSEAAPWGARSATEDEDTAPRAIDAYADDEIEAGAKALIDAAMADTDPISKDGEPLVLKEFYPQVPRKRKSPPEERKAIEKYYPHISSKRKSPSVEANSAEEYIAVGKVTKRRKSNDDEVPAAFLATVLPESSNDKAIKPSTPVEDVPKVMTEKEKYEAALESGVSPKKYSRDWYRSNKGFSVSAWHPPTFPKIRKAGGKPLSKKKKKSAALPPPAVLPAPVAPQHNVEEVQEKSTDDGKVNTEAFEGLVYEASVSQVQQPSGVTKKSTAPIDDELNIVDNEAEEQAKPKGVEVEVKEIDAEIDGHVQPARRGSVQHKPVDAQKPTASVNDEQEILAVGPEAQPKQAAMEEPQINGKSNQHNSATNAVKGKHESTRFHELSERIARGKARLQAIIQRKAQKSLLKASTAASSKEPLGTEHIASENAKQPMPAANRLCSTPNAVGQDTGYDAGQEGFITAPLLPPMKKSLDIFRKNPPKTSISQAETSRSDAAYSANLDPSIQQQNLDSQGPTEAPNKSEKKSKGSNTKDKVKKPKATADPQKVQKRIEQVDAFFSGKVAPGLNPQGWKNKSSFSEPDHSDKVPTETPKTPLEGSNHVNEAPAETPTPTLPPAAPKAEKREKTPSDGPRHQCSSGLRNFLDHRLTRARVQMSCFEDILTPREEEFLNTGQNLEPIPANAGHGHSVAAKVLLNWEVSNPIRKSIPSITHANITIHLGRRPISQNRFCESNYDEGVQGINSAGGGPFTQIRQAQEKGACGEDGGLRAYKS